MTSDKIEESFEVISERGWDGENWSRKVAFKLNQLYYYENRYIHQPDYKTMDVISESINGAV